MLNRVRYFFRSLLVKIIFLLLLVSFVFWGVGSFSLSLLNKDVLVTVGDKELSSEEFYFFSQNQIDRLGLSRLTGPQLLQAGIYDSLFQDFIHQNLLLNESEDLDIVLTQDTTESMIRSDPLFQDDTGTFSLAKFQENLLSSRQNEQSFISNLKRGYQAGLLARSIQKNWIPVRAFDTPLWRHQQQIRDMTMLSIPIVPDKLNPGDLALASWLKDQPLTIPEKRGGFVLEISAKQISATINVNDSEVLQRYIANQENLTQPERRTVRILNIDRDVDPEPYTKLSTAKEALLGDSVQEYRAVTEAGLRSQILITDISEAAFSYEQPGVLPPLVTDFATYIIEVKNFIPAVTPPLSNYRDLIHERLTNERANDLLYDIVGRMEDRLLDQVPFQAIAALNPYGEPVLIESSSFDETLLHLSKLSPDQAHIIAQEFFVLDQDFKFVNLVETTDNQFFLIGLETLSPSTQATIDSHREYALSEWQYQKGLKVARTEADILSRSFPASQDITIITGVTRDQSDSNHNISDDTRQKLFGIPKVSGTAVVEDKLAVHVIRLTDIRIPDTDASWSQDLQRRHQQALMQAYLDTLRNRHPVQYEQEEFEAIVNRLAGS